MLLPVVIDPEVFAHGGAGRLESGPRSIASVRLLRISITDRCNFRCVYCMPETGMAWQPKEQILRFEEIAEVCRAAIESHGIRRFKLTGGEPTVRQGLLDLVRMLAQLDGIEELSLTTNGFLLERLARPLREAGLHRLTISLDSLRAERFRRITRTGDLPTVLRGIDAALDAGFPSVKINCVTMRDVNDDELADFARLTLDRPVTVRFIEYMPLGDAALLQTAHHAIVPAIAPGETGPAGGCSAQDRGADSLVPEADVRRSIERELGPLIPVPREAEPGVGPANVYRLLRGSPRGRIGFISAMSEPFCASCNRLRLTADGELRSCLFEGGRVAIRELLRRTAAPDQRRRRIAEAMVRCVQLKPEVHSSFGRDAMSRIGG